MKITFNLPPDNTYHQYCIQCRSEDVHRIIREGKTVYLCNACETTSPRLIVIDPGINWWVEERTGEYWHESVGAFIYNTEGEILLFERVIYPFAISIPAGHLDTGEKPIHAVEREVREETGLNNLSFDLFSSEDVIGDSCRRGADCHKWHLFTTKLGKDAKVELNDEGVKPVWLSLEAALSNELVMPVRYFIQKYGRALVSKKPRALAARISS